jgi:peptidoglycan DL-endopeptidase LytF
VVKVSAQCPPGSFVYTIKAGNTLYQLAQQFNIPINAIIAFNPGLNPHALRVGQMICMPQVPSTCPVNNFYTIQPGDTIFQIAINYDVSLEALQNFNPGLDPNLISPGQRLCIPPRQSGCPGNNKYVIGPGETLRSIAQDFTVRPGDILIANPRLRPSEFTTGTTICIPFRQAP